MVHECHFFHPGRVLHVRKPALTTFITGWPGFVRPGLLGAAPIVQIPRTSPRHVVRYLGHTCPHPDVIMRQQEHVHAIEQVCASEHLRSLPVPSHPPLAENFFQMAWLKGIQKDKKLGYTCNNRAKNYSTTAKLKKGSSKVTKKGIFPGDMHTKHTDLLKEQAKAEAKDHAGTSKEIEMLFIEQSSAYKKSKKQYVGASESIERLISETEHVDGRMDEKTSVEDLEEGEIVGSPEHQVNVNANESLAVPKEGFTSHLSSVVESVENSECKVGFRSSEQIVNVVSKDDPQQLESTTIVDIAGQKNIGVPLEKMNRSFHNTSSAEALHTTECSMQVLHAKQDCQLADMDIGGNCLENQITPVQHLFVSTNLKPVEFDAGRCVEAVAKPEERSGNVMERKPSSSPPALEGDWNIQRLIETCPDEHRGDPVQTHSSLASLKVISKPQEESTASITTEKFFAALTCILPESACLNFDDKASSARNIMQGVVPFLSGNSGVLELFEIRNSCLKNRDPRRCLKASCFGVSESRLQCVALSKESTLQKRKYERQEGAEEAQSKRLCREREISSESNLDEHLNHQEPIDMEIDSLDPVVYASVDTCIEATSVSNASRDDDTLQKKPAGSEHSLVKDSAKPRLRSRDPRKALVDGGKARIGCVCAGETHETTPCISNSLRVLQERKKVSDPLSMTLCKGVSYRENIYFEGLMFEQLKTVHAERTRRIEEQNCMLNSKKLCLVLDLDHTLLNSAKFSEVDKYKAVLQEMEAGDRRSADNPSVKQDLYRFPKLGMWTKLRPGIWDFLSRASQLYELHVYTMGNKAYATEMATLLDPTGALFAGRVISRGDDDDRTFNSDVLSKSKNLDGVLGLESSIVIIDDSVQVWPHHRHNLIVVERYMYFPSSRRQFGLSGPSLLEIKHDERAADGMLASVLKVIEKIHHSFFSNQQLHDVDVRCILATEKQTVLAGCKILFSRIYPQGELQPHLHPLWQTAERFGAVCTTNIDDGVTHVVAISRGTDKVKWATRTGRFSVCPAWLEASAALYRRANECDFPVPL